MLSFVLPFETWISRVICTCQHDYILSIMKCMHDNVVVHNFYLIKMNKISVVLRPESVNLAKSKRVNFTAFGLSQGE